MHIANAYVRVDTIFINISTLSPKKNIFQIILSLVIGLCVCLPVPDAQNQNAFLNVRVVQQHVGGTQTGFGTSVSKQKVSKLKKGPEGETVEEEPFIDHQPPFLALPEVKPIEPLALPKRI